MKLKVFIILSALLLNLFAPLSIMAPREDEGPVIVHLNVCHASSPVLSSSGEMPCLGECPCATPPPSPVAVNPPFNPLFSLFIFPQERDLPPEA